MKYMKTYEFFSSGFSSPMRLSSLESFIVFSKKRYISKEYDDDDFKNIISILERDCKQFLNEIKKIGQPLFRGTRNFDEFDTGIGDRLVSGDREPVDTNKDISNIIDSYFQEKFGIKLRSSGIFATKLPNVASDYGTPYLFFPVDGYEYYWSKDITDLYGIIEPEEWYYSATKDYDNLESRWDMSYGENTEGGEWYYNDYGYGHDIISAVKKVKDNNPELKSKSFEYVKNILTWEPDIDFDSYKENMDDILHDNVKKIVDEYQKGNLDKVTNQELTFICDKYYLVDPGFYQKFIEYLKNPV